MNDELPYKESVLHYQGIAHDLAMASEEDIALLMIALVRRDRENQPKDTV